MSVIKLNVFQYSFGATPRDLQAPLNSASAVRGIDNLWHHGIPRDHEYLWYLSIVMLKYVRPLPSELIEKEGVFDFHVGHSNRVTVNSYQYQAQASSNRPSCSPRTIKSIGRLFILRYWYFYWTVRSAYNSIYFPGFHTGPISFLIFPWRICGRLNLHCVAPRLQRTFSRRDEEFF